MSADGIHIENTIPVLPVADRRVSERFYIQALGFRKDWGDDESTGAGSVSRNGHAIMLLGVGPRPSVGSTVWIGISDVATLHAALRRARGEGHSAADEPAVGAGDAQSRIRTGTCCGSGPSRWRGHRSGNRRPRTSPIGVAAAVSREIAGTPEPE